MDERMDRHVLVIFRGLLKRTDIFLVCSGLLFFIETLWATLSAL